jgi:hypothetical protein
MFYMFLQKKKTIIYFVLHVLLSHAKFEISTFSWKKKVSTNNIDSST